MSGSARNKLNYKNNTICGLVLAALVCAACGEDSDVLITPAPTTEAQNTDSQNPPPEGDDTDTDLTEADQLASDDDDVAGCGGCPTPSMGATCCTNADDISAVRATEADVCGVDMSEFGFPGCTQLDQPGALDTACPDVEFPPGPPMPGCCTAAGHCGGMETFLGFGCTSNPDSSTWVACGG